MADKPGLVWRKLARCVVCRAWWSVLPPLRPDERCGCGGELAVLTPEDWQQHLESLPYVPYKPETKKVP